MHTSYFNSIDSYVKSFEFRKPIDLQPPFSSITIAQSVNFLAMAICSAVSPSSATALGSAPANSNSCDCYGTFKKILKKEREKKKREYSYLKPLLSK